MADSTSAWTLSACVLGDSALTEGFQIAFLGGAMIAALGVVATLVLIRARDRKAHLEMSNETAGTAAA